jgi:hypothetical protein
MRHFVVGDDATGIGISKAALDHQAESHLPNEFLSGTVVRLLQQQMDEVFLRRGHGLNLAPTGGNLQSRQAGTPTLKPARLSNNK